MESRPVSAQEFAGRVQLCDERFARDKHRIEEQEARMRKIEELTIQMSEMVRRHDEQVKAHEQRIISLERQPADQYGKIKMVIITAVVSGVIGSIITAIPVLIKQ